jgi:hypothetical protein
MTTAHYHSPPIHPSIHPSTTSSIHQSVYMQNALKVFVAGAQPGACLDDEVAGMALVCSKRLVVFLQSNFVEVGREKN